MELDQARIAICERSCFDNLDLALHVIRARAAGLATSALVGIVPAMLFNYGVLWYFHSRRFSDEMTGGSYFLLVLLVMIEAPLATAPLTLYLGQAMFVEKPRARPMARDFWACLPQLLVLQVLMRTLLILPVVSWIVPYAIWPYLNEVILLERNPLFSGRGQISTLKRNSNLHRHNNGEFMLRALGALLLAPLLITALWLTQRYLLLALFGFEAPWGGQVIAAQAVLWLVVVYFTAARFLSYIDQRIRTEGWEVELFLRAESERLTRRVA
jgi:hypothetical protein